MLVPSAVGIVEGILEQFKPHFSELQYRNFSTYIPGLVACESRKNVEAINECFVEFKDQSPPQPFPHRFALVSSTL